MAVHKSAKTRIRRNARRAVINNDRAAEMRTGLKKLEAAIKAGDEKAAKEALKNVQPQMQRSANKGILHKKTASRKLSRLSARIKAIKKK